MSRGFTTNAASHPFHLPLRQEEDSGGNRGWRRRLRIYTPRLFAGSQPSGELKGCLVEHCGRYSFCASHLFVTQLHWLQRARASMLTSKWLWLPFFFYALESVNHSDKVRVLADVLIDSNAADNGKGLINIHQYYPWKSTIYQPC